MLRTRGCVRPTFWDTSKLLFVPLDQQKAPDFLHGLSQLWALPEATFASAGAMPQELPAFLKARLKARGIKVDGEGGEPPEANNRSSAAENSISPLPIGWLEAVDVKYGHAYYYNANLGKSSWVRPTNKDAHVIGVTVAAAAPVTLPLGWKSAVDPTSKRMYYCHESMKVTTWEPPAKVTIPVHNAVPVRAAPVAAGRKRQRAAQGGIDPMDPASYSDAPVGGWGAGLDSQTKEAGGASGRPLPSPGDVLRQNAQAQQPSESSYYLQNNGIGEAD